MAKRKGWEDLSDNYKQRLERGGINEAAYRRGESLQKARGHAKTPEHALAKVDRARFPEYYDKRERLIRQVIEKKERLFQSSRKFDSLRSEENVRNRPATNQNLQWFLDADDTDILDEIRTPSTENKWLFYH